LYLPQVWIDDADRRKACGVPENLAFATKQQISFSQIRNAVNAGIPSGVVVADAAYGDDTGFRDDLTDLGCRMPLALKERLPFGDRGKNRYYRTSGQVDVGQQPHDLRIALSSALSRRSI
jgi:SRSO17 transposase